MTKKNLKPFLNYFYFLIIIFICLLTHFCNHIFQLPVQNLSSRCHRKFVNKMNPTGNSLRFDDFPIYKINNKILSQVISCLIFDHKCMNLIIKDFLVKNSNNTTLDDSINLINDALLEWHCGIRWIWSCASCDQRHKFYQIHQSNQHRQTLQTKKHQKILRISLVPQNIQ